MSKNNRSFPKSECGNQKVTQRGVVVYNLEEFARPPAQTIGAGASQLCERLAVFGVSDVVIANVRRFLAQY